jgi:hypothetical protein
MCDHLMIRLLCKSAVSRAGGEKDEAVTNEETLSSLEAVEAAEKIQNGPRADRVACSTSEHQQS